MCTELYKGCSTINLTYLRGLAKREEKETFLKRYCPIRTMGYLFIRISKIIIILSLLNMDRMGYLDTILASNFGEVKTDNKE